MSPRATATALALLLLAASLPAATPTCCALRESAERTIISSMDCCSATLECPIAPQAIVTAASPSTIPTLRVLSFCPLSGGSTDSAILFARPPALLSFPGSAPSGPPPYRLHSQLLI